MEGVTWILFLLLVTGNCTGPSKECSESFSCTLLDSNVHNMTGD